MILGFEFKNLPKERPPSTECDVNPNNSTKTSLSNFCVANGKKLQIKTITNGDERMPLWMSSCIIDGEIYGKACASIKKSAEKEAANITLEMFRKEGNTLSSSRNYLPIFKDYLAEHNLEQRIEFKLKAEGPDHKRTWECFISLDGSDIAFGKGPTKKAAKEEASINAAMYWPS